MSNAVFPVLKGLGFPVIKRPRWSTQITEAVSGKETRLANWSSPRWEIELPFNYLKDGLDGKDDLKTLLGFFNARQGQFDNFLFDDPDDNYITGAALGFGNGEQLAFQLVRALDSWIEPRYDIKGVPAAKVYLDGNLQDGGYTIGLTTGLVTFAAPPGMGAQVSADFGFYYRVRFNTDAPDFEKFLRQVWETKKIPLITEK